MDPFHHPWAYTPLSELGSQASVEFHSLPYHSQGTSSKAVSLFPGFLQRHRIHLHGICGPRCSWLFLPFASVPSTLSPVSLTPICLSFSVPFPNPLPLLSSSRSLCKQAVFSGVLVLFWPIWRYHRQIRCREKFKNGRSPMHAMNGAGLSCWRSQHSRGWRGASTQEETLHPELLRALWPRVPVTLCMASLNHSARSPLWAPVSRPKTGNVKTLTVSSLPTSAEVRRFRFFSPQREESGPAVSVNTTGLPCKGT